MAIKLAVGDTSFTHLKPRITVIGVGGGGGNAISNMMAKNLEGVDFVVANTDAQALALSPATRKIQLGLEITQGLGAGARPEIGRMAAEEAKEDIEKDFNAYIDAASDALDGISGILGSAATDAQESLEELRNDFKIVRFGKIVVTGSVRSIITAMTGF